MPLDSPDYLYIVPKDSALGQRLAALTDVGLRTLCDEFDRRFRVKVEITPVEEDDEPTVHNGAWVDFSRYEIAFFVQRLRQIREFEDLAFAIGTAQE